MKCFSMNLNPERPVQDIQPSRTDSNREPLKGLPPRSSSPFTSALGYTNLLVICTCICLRVVESARLLYNQSQTKEQEEMAIHSPQNQTRSDEKTSLRGYEKRREGQGEGEGEGEKSRLRWTRNIGIEEKQR